MTNRNQGDLVTIYLRGGASFTVRMSNWKITKSNLDNTITRFEWTDADDYRLPYVSLSEIAAVVVAP